MRAGRLVQLLRLLHTHGQMTMCELAAALEVSGRTIARDVEVLSGAGVPIYTVRGVRGGVALLGDGNADLAGLGALGATSAKAAGSATAQLRITTHGRRLAGVLGRPAGIRVHRGGAGEWVAATMPYTSLEVATYELLALGPEVSVIGPPELRRRLHEAALRIAAANEDHA